MKLRVTALIFAPGFALVGSLAGGWVGAAGGLGVWLLLVGAATVAHLMIARAALPAEQRDPPSATLPQVPRPVPSRHLPREGGAGWVAPPPAP